MTHEDLQRWYAECRERGRLPAPRQKYATKLVHCEERVDEYGYAKIDETPAHERATVRYLTFSELHGVWVHYYSCDFTGRGNEMFAGNNSEALEDFWTKFPVMLEE